MATKAVYPGTFDPITFGHIDVVKRAAKLFDEVIVAVAEDTHKAAFFSADERVSFAKDAFAKFKNVKVLSFSGLLVDLVKQHHFDVVIRGLRAVSDFEYEFQLASMNRRLCPEFETVFLTPSENLAFISSSLIREIAKLGGEVKEFVPESVVKAFASKEVS